MRADRVQADGTTPGSAAEFIWTAGFNNRFVNNVASSADRPATGVTMVLRNNTVRPWPGRAVETIQMSHTTAKGNSQPDDKYSVFVYDYQGQAGNNFRVYFHPQATQNLYGGVAPCANTTMRPEIDGITCPLTGMAPTAPSPPTGVRIIR